MVDQGDEVTGSMIYRTVELLAAVKMLGYIMYPVKYVQTAQRSYRWLRGENRWRLRW